MKKLNLILCGLILVPGICGYESMASAPHSTVPARGQMEIAREFEIGAANLILSEWREQGEKVKERLARIDSVKEKFETTPGMNVKDKLAYLSGCDFNKLGTNVLDRLTRQLEIMMKSGEGRAFALNVRLYMNEISTFERASRYQSHVTKFINYYDKQQHEYGYRGIVADLEDKFFFDETGTRDEAAIAQHKQEAEEAVEEEAMSYLASQSEAYEIARTMIEYVLGTLTVEGSSPQ